MTIKAWHFINKRRRLGYGDGRVVRVGRTYKIKGDPVLCHWGLHGSVRIVDALEYASGPILCRVEIGGKIIKGDDKLVGTKRTVLSMVDITEELRALARKCALDIIHLWDAPKIVVDYLKTGDENLRAEADSLFTDNLFTGDSCFIRVPDGLQRRMKQLSIDEQNIMLATAQDAASVAVRAAMPLSHAAEGIARNAVRIVAKIAARIASRDPSRGDTWYDARREQVSYYNRYLLRMVDRAYHSRT